MSVPTIIGKELDMLERELTEYWFAIECGWEEDMNQDADVTSEKMMTKAYYKLCDIWERISQCLTGHPGIGKNRP